MKSFKTILMTITISLSSSTISANNQDKFQYLSQYKHDLIKEDLIIAQRELEQAEVSLEAGKKIVIISATLFLTLSSISLTSLTLASIKNKKCYELAIRSIPISAISTFFAPISLFIGIGGGIHYVISYKDYLIIKKKVEDLQTQIK